LLELSLHILDGLQNSVEAGATRIELEIDEDLEKDRMFIVIADNGRGMSEEMAAGALNPFVTTRKTRHVGLGLPLFAAAARQCEGDLVIQSKPGQGTRLEAFMRHSHLDRAPLGDMPSALMAVLLSGRPVDVAFTHKAGARVFRFDSSEVRRELEDVPLTHPEVRQWIFETLREGEASLRRREESRPEGRR
jgi:hypothetical protein